MELSVLGVSSSRGCAGCHAILQCLSDQLAQQELTIDSKSLQEECKLYWLVGDRQGSQYSLMLGITVKIAEGEYRKREFCMWIGYDGQQSPHPAARRLNQAIADGYTGSAASLDILSRWVKDCDATHQKCKQPPSSLPYRILRLSKVSQDIINVILVEGLKTNEPYACLSHRWGESTLRCRTTKGTIATHLEGVPWNSLPKTFQQAATVTLALGLKYMWIDSLCIVQDDKEDWKVQAAQMCNIYRGSYITIAATSSSDSDQGLFWKVPTYPVMTRRSRSGHVWLRESPAHQYQEYANLDNGHHDFPLLSRGWVFQERILAPRVVHFGRCELRFEDVQPDALCTCGSETSWPRKDSHYRSLASSDEAMTRGYWHNIVNQFISLELTFYSDYLPALAGVARQYGTAHEAVLGRYVAGLWERTLLHDLPWYVVDGYPGQRPEGCSTPTWSWASTTAGRCVTLAYTRATEDLTIKESRSNLAGPDEYGPIDSAHLVVEGRFITGSWKWVATKKLTRRIHFYIDNRQESYYMHLDYNFSISGNSWHVPEFSKLYCLKTGFVGDGCHVCLVLRAVNTEQNIFERIGLLMEAPGEVVNRWFESCSGPEIIKLV
ncbi:heterokaryon incompatibility protein-domain-containing protein [Stachybotrys elegans]|uniref:Heterokaryon incompatibility protein-domain-containing protein n=1 Tax=Stachybotrys elegans TaxID=80388 RepID=A0A8K0SNW9_9HYPO|nr:heterokaryon incompatibility protein-domain-containing protein [Stachybotrys elegans]